MQRENTLHHLRRKLSAISEGRGSVFDPYDLDRFLIRLPLHYHDSYLDSSPSEEAVRELEEEGCPRWPLVSKGSVNQTTAFLAFRRNRRLQARLLRARGWFAGRTSPGNSSNSSKGGGGSFVSRRA
jgi:hypothetical protein